MGGGRHRACMRRVGRALTESEGFAPGRGSVEVTAWLVLERCGAPIAPVC